MKIESPLPNDKKLMMLFRVEPGCLGPDGIERIKKFCVFAQEQTVNLVHDFAHLDIVPRFDKNLPELEYKVNAKSLSRDKAAQFFQLFEKDLDEFEENLNEELGLLIDEFIAC